MIDIDSMPKFNELQYTFQFESNEGKDCKWIISKDSKYVGDAILTSQSERKIKCSEDIKTDVQLQFELYLKRPESKVGQYISKPSKEIYEELLAGVYMIKLARADKNPDEFIPIHIERMLTWLEGTDFYRAPASTRYHESFASGLLVHTIKVYNCMLTLNQSPAFGPKVDIASSTLCALVHDWCKIGLYTPYQKNVKNEETSQWEKVTAYKVEQQTGIPLGHGVSSMFIASRFFNLTTDEALAIRWHMGWCRVVDSEMNELQLANESFPLVHLIQFADQLAITSYI